MAQSAAECRAEPHSQLLPLLLQNLEMTQREIAKFSAEDAAAYPLYEQHLSKLTAYQRSHALTLPHCHRLSSSAVSLLTTVTALLRPLCARLLLSFFEPFLDAPPPGSASSLRERLSQLRTLASAARRAVGLGRGLLDFHEVMTAPAARILSRWFQSEPLRSTLATDAIIGAMTSPQVPGSGYVLFHHVMGEVDGRQGVWAYVEGGMGAVSSAIASAARARGATLVTNAAVQEIVVDSGGRVSGVLLANGQTVAARRVISNVSPTVTYGGLLPARHLPAEFMRDVRSIDTTSPVTKINLSMSRLPAFSCCPPLTDGQPGPQHRGTIHFVESMQQIEDAYHDALAGRPSARPVIEMTIPSALDPTLAPAGHHVASLFTQYTPYSIAGGWTAEAKQAYAARCFALIDQYAPGFSSSILHYEVLTPPDLEAELGLSGGNIFHTAMGLDQLFWLRPVKGQHLIITTEQPLQQTQAVTACLLLDSHGSCICCFCRLVEVQESSTWSVPVRRWHTPGRWSDGQRGPELRRDCCCGPGELTERSPPCHLV